MTDAAGARGARSVELRLCSRRHHEVIEGDAAHSAGNHPDHAPVERLVVQGVEAAAQQHQLLRVQRQIPEVFCIAQRLRITCGRPSTSGHSGVYQGRGAAGGGTWHTAHSTCSQIRFGLEAQCRAQGRSRACRWSKEADRRRREGGRTVWASGMALWKSRRCKLCVVFVHDNCIATCICTSRSCGTAAPAGRLSRLVCVASRDRMPSFASSMDSDKMSTTWLRCAESTWNCEKLARREAVWESGEQPTDHSQSCDT